MYGDEGSGKGTLARILGRIFGTTHYAHVSSKRHLGLDDFSGHLMSALLVFSDEILWGCNRDVTAALKSIITDEYRTFEEKYKSPVKMKNLARFIFATNEDWCITASPNSRRWFVLHVSDKRTGPEQMENLNGFNS